MAMGDVKGGPQFTYLSLDDFRIIRDQLFGDKKRDIGDRDPVQYAVFIDPPLAHIGITEEEALKRGYSFKVSRLPGNFRCPFTYIATDGRYAESNHQQS